MRRYNLDFTTIAIIIILMASSVRHGGFSSPTDWLIDKIMLVPAVIIGLSFHEFAHAFAAWKLGDPTPKFQGRVTVNPMAHIDPLGLAALFFCGFGWGVPVHINPDNFRNRRKGELIVGLAGVAMNLLIAIVFSIVARVIVMALGASFISGNFLGTTIWTIVIYIIQINLVLMIFNLIPCPPLDGFNVLANIGNFAQTDLYWKLYRYGNFILLFIIIFGVTSMIITPCVSFIMNILWNVIIV